jgi:hypothetical protein
VLPVSELSGEDASVSSPHANVALPDVEEDDELDEADDVEVVGSSAENSDERSWLAALAANPAMAGSMAVSVRIRFETRPNSSGRGFLARNVPIPGLLETHEKQIE